MDRVDLGPSGNVEDLVHVKVGLSRGHAVEGEGFVGKLDEQTLGVGVRVDSHARNTGVLGGTDDAHRDLATVCDEYPLDGPVHGSSDRLSGRVPLTASLKGQRSSMVTVPRLLAPKVPYRRRVVHPEDPMATARCGGGSCSDYRDFHRECAARLSWIRDHGSLGR